MNFQERAMLPARERDFIREIRWLNDYWSENETELRDLDGYVIDWDEYSKLNEDRLRIILDKLLDDKEDHPIWNFVESYDELLERLHEMSESWDDDESIHMQQADIFPGAIRIAQAIWALEGLAGYSEFAQFGNLPLDAL